MLFNFFELIKTVMGMNSLAGITRWIARSVFPFARICAFVLLVSTMLPAWGDDVVAVLFEFLDDDTKLAQSCTDWLFSKHIEPEPAPEDPVEWAMAEATVDEDDAPMPDAPPEPELIDMPPAPASAPRMSNLRCIALRLVYGAGPR